MRIANRERRVLSRARVEQMQEKAVAFLRDVVGNEDLADEIEDLSLEEYADRKKVRLENPNRKGGQPTMPSKRELEEENEALQERIEELEETLSTISESVNSALPEDGEDGDDGEREDLGEEE